MQRFASSVNRAQAVPAAEGYRRPRLDRRDFKRFLSEGPDFDALEIVRAPSGVQLLNPWQG